MVFLKSNYLLKVILFVVFSQIIAHSQVIFRDLPNYKIPLSEKLFFDISPSRSIISLNGDWKVYNSDDDDKKKTAVQVPSVFEGKGSFVFEKEFSLTPSQLSNNLLELFFLGLNYNADISVNNIIIYRHSGGEFPFSVNLPRDILYSDHKNVLSVQLTYELDSKNTIPFKQRFLFPHNFGGITSDVFIHLKPNICISSYSIKPELNEKLNKGKIDFAVNLKNNEFRISSDSVASLQDFSLKVIVYDKDSNVVRETENKIFNFKRNSEQKIEQSLEIDKPALWSPADPELYSCKIELWQNGELRDISTTKTGFYNFYPGDGSLFLNNQKFNLKGVTYIPSNSRYGRIISYKQMEDDIKLIKQTGFNSVRFEKCVPHPFLLHLCDKYGLLAFVELPVAVIPPGVAQDQNYIQRCKNFITNYVSFFSKNCSFTAIGLGSTYLPEYQSHISFLSNLASFIKEKSDKLIYASFGSLAIPEINNLDFYGIELLNIAPGDITPQLEKLFTDLGKSKVFISEATYPVSIGNTDGYVNAHSYEAQAKYFEELIDYSNTSGLGGYFINTMIDFQGDYSSLISGYNEQNIYNIGIVGQDRSTSRLGYKVINAKQNNQEKVTIPIGSKKDDAPMVFIVFGLLLALLMGVLVNSGKKFREDSSRALLRPYNFFADVRDQRIMSAFHTTFLGVISAFVIALIEGNLLYYFKENIVFEKILLSLGNESILKTINYLSWHPFTSIIWLLLAGITFIIVLALIIKIASFFVRTRVYMSSVYFTVIWSLLPMVLLIPVGIILYRVLVLNIINPYIYILLALIVIWILYRLMKGIYVIFDARPASVYFYSIIVLLFLFVVVLFYFEVENSTIQYLLFTFKQYHLFG
jgi:Glycosyl hydrolases family 2/Glycosyl hydrolases family 2, TIM barrel domain